MNVNGSNTISIAFSDGTTGNNATEMRYNGTIWVLRGAQGFAPGSVWYLRSAVSPTSTHRQYVVFSDNINGNRATVMQYVAGSWSVVGPGAISTGQITGDDIAVDSQGNPYVAFLDSTDSNRVTVAKFDGTQWNVVGRPGFTTGSVDYLSLAISPGDVPYVSFRDPSNGSKASVMAYH